MDRTITRYYGPAIFGDRILAGFEVVNDILFIFLDTPKCNIKYFYEYNPKILEGLSPEGLEAIKTKDCTFVSGKEFYEKFLDKFAFSNVLPNDKL